MLEIFSRICHGDAAKMYRYGLLDKSKVHTIVVNHLVGGTPVEAYLIKT